MKKKLLIMFAFFASTAIFAQTETMNLWKNGNKFFSINVDNIDSVTFSQTAIEFTCGTSTLIDIDDNIYNTVQIGDQCWMKENLKVTKYNNNNPIVNAISSSDWANNTTGAYCYYDNNIENVASRGALYNWYAANNTNGLCPTGWHVPIDTDWDLMFNYLIDNGYNYDGSFGKNAISKSLASIAPNDKGYWETFLASEGVPGKIVDVGEEKRNSSGFSVVPSGSRWTTGTTFVNLNTSCTFWSTTLFNSSYAFTRAVYYNFPNSGALEYHFNSGFSVRCLRN